MIHQTLKMMRLNNRLTQQQVAKLLNIDRSTYTYYETGKIKPDVDTLIKLCCIFNVSLEMLTKDTADNREAVRESVEEYLHNGENSQTFTSLNRQEQRAILLFRLCRNKDETIETLKEMALNPDDRHARKDTPGKKEQEKPQR